jgi:hypothetical protein
MFPRKSRRYWLDNYDILPVGVYSQSIDTVSLQDHVHWRLCISSFGYWGHLFRQKAIRYVVKGFVGLENIRVRGFVCDAACMCLAPCACESIVSRVMQSGQGL